MSIGRAIETTKNNINTHNALEPSVDETTEQQSHLVIVAPYHKPN